MAAAPSPAASEAAYYQAIEEFFVSRRGDPLLLSNADWLLIRGWRRAGIPLRVVLRGIADALDAHAHSFSRDRKVGSLRYCAAEVEEARERWERALAQGLEPDPDPQGWLEARAAELRGAVSGLGPRASPLAAELAEALRRRAAAPLPRRDLEAWLAVRETALLEALGHDAGRQALERIEAEVEAGLAPYRERMPERVLGQIRADAHARRLLEAHGLRRLSLFHD